MFSRANKNKGKKSNLNHELEEDTGDLSKEAHVYDVEKEDPIFNNLDVNSAKSASNEPPPWEPNEFGEQVISNTKHNDLFEEEVFEQTSEKDTFIGTSVSKEETFSPKGEVEEKIEQDELIEKFVEESIDNRSSELHEKVDGLNSLIGNQFSSIEKKLDQLSNDFEVKLKNDQHKEQTIDKLHSELQVYKDNMIHERLMPVVMDLILTIDRTSKLRKLLDKDVVYEKHLKVIDGAIIDLEDTLYKQGVESYECDGSQFHSSKQKVVRTIKTEDALLDKQIAERLGKGYEWNEKVIRKEQVSVYVFEKKEE